ncbi:hypothetical protein PENTCL1PPCAC_24694 [Pristionchus entomophagus]|uniref:Uncharacterized protein n=1 Tax=Pristionchus entomophagus TaxID=358040 RepID=A0AAV5U8J7_9BILA|nr:hypothetical protein PENTCL1PPCAC_24694 [Pristionchus entomophagus]
MDRFQTTMSAEPTALTMKRTSSRKERMESRGVARNSSTLQKRNDRTRLAQVGRATDVQWCGRLLDR